MLRLRLFVSRSAVFFLLSMLPAVAQTTTGSIVGTIADPTGAVVANAAVTATNVDTGATTKTTTDSSGNYVVTPLPVGRYSVTIEAHGFKKSVNEGITLNVQDRIGVNVVLEVGQITETVDVKYAAPALQTDTSYLGQVIESEKIVDLPLNGRFFTRLAVLTAGVAPTAPGARDERTGGFSANGVRPYQNNYLLDGIDNNSLSEDLTNEASFVVGPSPDAIAEFRVQTNSMSAEFGRSGGAVLNVTLKSGTNQFHGSVFEFLRNSALDAKNFFDPATGPTPPFKQNQFGAAVGGPVELPGYNGKNRTFFFADYQGTRIRTAHTFLATVAPVGWRTGNFSGFNTLIDPKTSLPFVNNQIPLARFDAASLKLISLMPAPMSPVRCPHPVWPTITSAILLSPTPRIRVMSEWITGFPTRTAFSPGSACRIRI